MVFQTLRAVPAHERVRQHGLRPEAGQGAEGRDRARGAAARPKILQIEHLLERKPKDLSGGQRQRVAIGRAIVRKPEVFLFDEPLSNLDAALRVRMRYEFAKLHEDLKTTMIYVTHDQVEAMTLADRIVVLNAGRIEQVGTPLELYEHPDNLFVAGFIGSPRMNFIRRAAGRGQCARRRRAARVGRADQLRGRRQQRRAASQEVTLGVRPGTPQPGRGRPTGSTVTVTFVESLGSSTQAYCVLPGVEEALTCTLGGQSKVRDGQSLALSIAASDCYLFDASGKAFSRRLPAAAVADAVS